MGMRAVMQLVTPSGQESFYAQYGSPVYKLPALADWIAAHAPQGAHAGAVPAARDYLEQTAGSDLDHFREAFHARLLPSDLDWTYQLTITEAFPGRYLRGPAWFGHLIVRGPMLWRIGPHAASVPVAHLIRFDADDHADLGRQALHAARQQLRAIEAGRVSTRNPDASREWWAGVEARWSRYAPASDLQLGEG